MKFYKSIKFKALAGTLLLAAILCAAFIRTIPDYSTSRGFAVVSLSDYNKYKQGYCLKEDRILPKEELYKRAIAEYLEKELEATILINNFRCKKYGTSWCKRNKASYYKAKNSNLNEILRILETEKNDIEYVVLNKIEVVSINPSKYIKINLNKMSAGFNEPIFFENLLFLDYSFLLYDNFIALNHSVFISNFTTAKDFLSEYYIDKKNQPIGKKQFDNCGNLNFDVKEYYLQSREAKGG